MLSKMVFFAVGLADVLNEKFNELAVTGEERLTQWQNSQTEYEIEVEDVEPAPEQAPSAAANATVDDLTKISGIGPTFAKRLQEAGITTYEELAALSADQLREITKAADWQADPSDWIMQAKAVA